MSICLVCHAEITGQQFGTDCCRPCAAFFRRTLQLNLTYKCQFSSGCDVSNKNRWSCRACRLKRCYSVGMANFVRSTLRQQKSGESSESPSSVPNSAEQSPQAPPITFEVHPLDAERIKQEVKRLFTGPKTLLFSHNIPLSMCQEALLAYETHCTQWPGCTKDKIRFNDVFDMVAHMENSLTEIIHVATFCMSLTPFVQLPYDQKGVIFKNIWMRFCEIDRTYITCQLTGNELKNHYFVLYDGLAVNVKSPNIPKIYEICNDTSVLPKIMGKNQELIRKTFLNPFKLFRPDLFEVVYLILFDMWNVKEYEGMRKETIDVADQVLKRLAEEIHTYYIFEKKMRNYASRLYKLKYLSTALDKSVGLRKEEGFISKTFRIFKHDFHLSELHQSL